MPGVLLGGAGLQHVTKDSFFKKDIFCNCLTYSATPDYSRSSSYRNMIARMQQPYYKPYTCIVNVRHNCHKTACLLYWHAEHSKEKLHACYTGMQSIPKKTACLLCSHAEHSATKRRNALWFTWLPPRGGSAPRGARAIKKRSKFASLFYCLVFSN